MVRSAASSLCFLFCFIFSLDLSSELNPEALMKTPEVVRLYGYPVETHSVTTEDGYVLVLHRIPSGRKFSRCFNKIPVLLIHGVLSSSIAWVENTEKSLGFVLADAGYDVWMGNLRGNSYSHKHVNLSYSDHKYWEFCFDQHALIDVPTMIDYILTLTNQRSVLFSCHSMGCLLSVIMLSSKQEYKFKVMGIAALAPAWGANNFGGYFFPYVLKQHIYVESIVKLFKTWYIPPNKEGVAGFSICKTYPFLCYSFLNMADGENFFGYNLSRIEIIFHQYPDVSSERIFTHFAQWRSKHQEATAFDYEDPAVNYIHYKQMTPPTYDFRTVDVPIAVFWGPNDYLADSTDVVNGVAILPRVKFFYEVPDPKFNHGSFLWGLHVKELVYDKVIEIFKQFSRRCF